LTKSRDYGHRAGVGAGATAASANPAPSEAAQGEAKGTTEGKTEVTTEGKTEVTLKTAGERAAYAAKAKARLLALVAEMQGEEDHLRVGILMDGLEAVHKYQPIATLGFLGLALAGEWRLAYTTSNRQTFALSHGVRVLSITQTLEPTLEDGGDGSSGATAAGGAVRTRVAFDLTYVEGRGDLWTLDSGDAEAGGALRCEGVFSVTCSYSLLPNGGMALGEPAYSLEEKGGGRVLSSGAVAVDKLCSVLEAATPPELFHTQNATAATTYLDADLRVVVFDLEAPRGPARVALTRILPASPGPA